jgi:hypothetical protein
MMEAQFAKRAFEAPSHQSSYSRKRLDHNDHPVAMGGQVADRLSEPGSAEGPPVKIIDPLGECGFQSRRGDAVACRHSETAYVQSGSAEYGIPKRSADRSHRRIPCVPPYMNTIGSAGICKFAASIEIHA